MRGALLLLVAALGCERAELPGESVGEFRISGRLDSNSCGPSATRAPPSVEFEVEIRRDGKNGWWIAEGQVPVAGILDDQGTFQFAVAARELVREEDPVLGLAPCVMDRVDEVRGFLLEEESDDGEEVVAAAVDGEETLSFAAVSGADCSDLLGLGAGQFLALPCQLRYELGGQRIPSPSPSD